MPEIENISSIIEEVTKRESVEDRKIVYDSGSESLEPLYFWTLDLMNDIMGDVEKLTDNFVSTPGSGHFAELGARATRMQEESMKILGSINTVIKSIINIIYDLKEFQTRLSHYNAVKSEKKQESEAAQLALKQIWMDQVDIKKGRGSINMLAQDMEFVTLRDAFMTSRKIQDIDKLDLNDRVKRILKPRMLEFLEWVKRSEVELRKRYEIERAYLKSQVNALKLYTRWAKPYLKAATELEMKETAREPEMVKAFSTIVFELALLGKKAVKFEDAVIDKELPESFKNVKMKRKYYSCVVVDFYFRGLPQRVTQQAHYTFGGRTEISFKAFTMNDDELKMFNQKLENSNINEALKLVTGVTEESLEQMREDIETFLEEEETKERKEEKKKAQDTNPFVALFKSVKKEKKDEKEEQTPTKKIKKIKADNYVEKAVRVLAEKAAKRMCFTLYDVYKKSHGMASHQNPYDEIFVESED